MASIKKLFILNKAKVGENLNLYPVLNKKIID